MPITIPLTPKEFAEMVYESTMYRLHNIRALQEVQEVWNSIDVDDRPVTKKPKSIHRSREVFTVPKPISTKRVV